MKNKNKFLTEICQHCGGTGIYKAKQAWMDGGDCVRCRGVGQLPNKEGEDIIELIKLHVRY